MECGAGLIPFSAWVQHSEAFNGSRSEKLDLYLKLAYGVLRDVLAAWNGVAPSNNRDVQPRITNIAEKVSFTWIQRATLHLDELIEMVKRNIQKTGALDALVVNLRNDSDVLST